jgi:alkylation response protein AidB-like acyl-CoA dehydrogenase
MKPFDTPIARELRRFADKRLDAAATEAGGLVDRALVTELANLGVFGITIPEDAGGLGLSLGDACAAVIELSRADRSVATMVGLHLGLGTRAITAFAAPEVAAEWLPRLASGEAIGAFSATETCAGSDLTMVRTQAREEGKEVVVDGEKAYVTNARFAGCFTVLTRWGTRANALVLVPANAPGVEVGREEHKLGIHASSTATITFNGVRVPRSYVLTEQGLESAHRVLAWGRTLMSAGCVGTAQAALDATAVHVAGRKQFGRTLGEMPSVRMAVARMAAVLFGMRATVAAAAEASGGDESIVAKIYASEGAFEVCDTAVQLHGALGVIEDVGVARLLRDCRVTRIFEGANDVLLSRLSIARLAVRPVATTRDAKVTPSLAAKALAADELARSIDGAIAEVRAKFGAAVIHRQPILACLGRAMVAQRAADSVLAVATEDDAHVAGLAVSLLARQGALALAALGEQDALERESDRVCRDLIASPVRPATASKELRA